MSKSWGITLYQNSRFNTCRNLGFFKEYQDIRPTSYPNPSFNTFQDLRLFHKNHVSWRQKPMPCFVCHNLGTFKKHKDIGLPSYRNLRLAPVKILGYFVRTMFFAAKNPHGLIFLIKILGFMKSAMILGQHCITVAGLTPVEILGYFLRTRLLTPKTHCLYGLSKSWVF